DPEGNVLAERIGPETQRKLFERAGGQPATTQEAEVQRVQSRVNSAVSGAGDGKQQTAALAHVLLPFAETNAQRERLFACRFWLGTPQNQAALKQNFDGAFAEADRKFQQPPPAGQAKPTIDELFTEALNARSAEPAGPLAAAFLKVVKDAPARKPFAEAFEEALEAQRAELDGELKALFAEALSGTRRPPGTGKLGVSEQRAAIARLLFGLVDAVPEQQAAAPNQAETFADTPKFRRFITVVGLREAAQAADAQAEALVRITSELNGERSREMGLFAKTHMALLGQVQQRAREVSDHSADLQRKNEQLAAQDVLVKRRQSEVDSYKSELADSRRTTAARLKELRAMSQSLFEERVKLRDATRENQKLEKDLHKLEEGR
ncbi:MAG TPA: hypothetical protein VFE78_39295, partial [Gemmataceae bacterium]|nr:hypothetical protein [Gemmataceae bacterium]